jgi:hypothetical protein
MTIQLNKVAIADPPTTVLSYGITTGTLKIVISNLHPPAAQCMSLVFAIAVGTSAGQTAAVQVNSEFTLEWNASACTGCTIEEISQGTLIGNFGSGQGGCPVYVPATPANLCYMIMLTGNDGKTYFNYPSVNGSVTN